VNGLDLYSGDAVIVEVQNGHHLGFVSMQGDLVRLQMRKKGVQESDDMKVVYRLASPRTRTSTNRPRPAKCPPCSAPARSSAN
jgi:hypothetical protein